MMIKAEGGDDPREAVIAAALATPEGQTALCAPFMTVKSDPREEILALLLSKPELRQAMKEVVSALNDLAVAHYNYRREATRLLIMGFKHGPSHLAGPDVPESELLDTVAWERGE